MEQHKKRHLACIKHRSVLSVSVFTHKLGHFHLEARMNVIFYTCRLINLVEKVYITHFP